MRKKIKFAIASYINESQYEQAIAKLNEKTDYLLRKYQNRKGIYYICPLLIEKYGDMWYGEALDLPILPLQPRSCIRSHFHWLCILKLKILCMIDINLYYQIGG